MAQPRAHKRNAWPRYLLLIRGVSVTSVAVVQVAADDPVAGADVVGVVGVLLRISLQMMLTELTAMLPPRIQ